MDATQRKAGLTLIVIGAVFMPLAPIAGGLIDSAAVRSSASLATSLGGLLFTIGCIRIAQAKGQP